MRNRLLFFSFVLLSASGVAHAGSPSATSLAEHNELLFNTMQTTHNLTDHQISAVRELFAKSRYISQGNPAVTRHPATTRECQEKLKKLNVHYENPAFAKTCGDRYMAPLYNPSVEKPEDAAVCIDQFEFPNIPCAYPVVWVRASEAAQLCESVGKRLCDAHEWEGACAGSLEQPDYRFDLAAGNSPEKAIRLMREAHNEKYRSNKLWSYGTAYKEGICAAAGYKSKGCEGGGWNQCGSNTYPAGFFPDCHSSLGVYDLHGNAAEHMSLPIKESQMASLGSREYGYTEMKGSWFIFDHYRAHEDWCRWRAPFWHGSRVMDSKSHHNYHLGFRCCKTVNEKDVQ